MLKFDIRAAGTGEEKLEALKSAVAQAHERALAETAEALERDIRESLGKPASGGASEPYEPPRKRSGQLQSSMSCRVSKNRSGETVLEAGDLYGAAPYSGYLERGTRKMAPRPFLVPALLRSAAELARRIKGLLLEIKEFKP